MYYILFFIFFIICYFLYIIISINRAVAQSFLSLNDPESSYEKIDVISDKDFLTAFNRFSEWAEKNGFEHDYFYLTKAKIPEFSVKNSLWWSEKDRTYATLMTNQALSHIEFLTRYEDTATVATGSSKFTMIYPSKPFQYKQAFTDLTNDERYERHLQAREKVEAYHNFSIPDEKKDMLELMTANFPKFSQFITSIPFWKMRGFYWQFIRKHLKSNKPITVPAK